MRLEEKTSHHHWSDDDCCRACQKWAVCRSCVVCFVSCVHLHEILPTITRPRICTSTTCSAGTLWDDQSIPQMLLHASVWWELNGIWLANDTHLAEKNKWMGGVGCNRMWEIFFLRPCSDRFMAGFTQSAQMCRLKDDRFSVLCHVYAFPRGNIGASSEYSQ